MVHLVIEVQTCFICNQQISITVIQLEHTGLAPSRMTADLILSSHLIFHH
jgi:hypothetical protein